MNFIKVVIVFAASSLCFGCGSADSGKPPELTEAVQSEIEAEDAAIEDAERNNR